MRRATTPTPDSTAATILAQAQRWAAAGPPRKPRPVLVQYAALFPAAEYLHFDQPGQKWDIRLITDHFIQNLPAWKNHSPKALYAALHRHLTKARQTRAQSPEPRA